MDFAWSDQQRELLDAVGRFASQQLHYDVIENDRDGVLTTRPGKNAAISASRACSSLPTTAGSALIHSLPWQPSSVSGTPARITACSSPSTPTCGRRSFRSSTTAPKHKRKNTCPAFLTERSSAATP